MTISFPIAESQLRLLKGDCSTQWDQLERKVAERHFNHGLEILIPNSFSLPKELDDLKLAYYTTRLPLSHMAKPGLLRQYPTLVALSVGDRIDVGNVYALVPPGKLIMAIDKDVAEQLGLDSKPSHFDKSHRRFVEIDLSVQCYMEGRLRRERLDWCLSQHPELQHIDFILCHSTDATELQTNYCSEKHLCERVMEVLEDLCLPHLDPQLPTGDEAHNKIGAVEFCTWLGSVACRLKSSQELADSYVSTFVPPCSDITCPATMHGLLRGMVHAEQVCKILRTMRDYSAKDPWVVLNVWGFDDSPVSWRTTEHGFATCSANGYTVILFASGLYWFISSFGAYDIIQ